MATSKMTRKQCKENAELREARRTAERLRRQKAAFRKLTRRTLGGRIVLAVHSWSRGARRGILAAFVVLAAATAWCATLDSATHTAAETLLVRTIPAREVQVVKRSSDWFAPKSGPSVDVDIDGKPVRLEHGRFDSRDLSVGDEIRVVVDPADRSHVVAVGEPGDREDTTGDEVVTGVLAGLGAVFFSVLVAALLLGPELEAWEEKRRAAQREKTAAVAQGAQHP